MTSLISPLVTPLWYGVSPNTGRRGRHLTTWSLYCDLYLNKFLQIHCWWDLFLTMDYSSLVFITFMIMTHFWYLCIVSAVFLMNFNMNQLLVEHLKTSIGKSIFKIVKKWQTLYIQQSYWIVPQSLTQKSVLLPKFHDFDQCMLVYLVSFPVCIK